ncbi:sigma 54-interacting transcriptional regulator [Dermatophilaceae bacterium Soc4.6]
MVDTSSTHPTPATIGQLRDSGYTARTVKEEIRANLVGTLRAGGNAFPGIVGFDDTVLPDVQRALLAGHDFVLLGERGQGKTRLMRTIVGLLDEWSPEIAGCEIHDEPLGPICARCKALVASDGDDVPVVWRHRDERYTEKLATPDTSVGDLVGDVDPTKVAEGRTLGDPETIHYGLLPRGHRGVFALNELPDLAERIQVALFNVLEERDIQVRGYAVRLPLDMLVVASANPEDYTNRGRIITPLKDRFGAEVRTHYLDDLEQEIALIRQEADLVALVPAHVVEVIARLVHQLRGSSSIDQRSGVSARFAIAAAEATAASALRRSAMTGEADAVARIGDLGDVLPTLRGKVEFEMGEEGRELEVVGHLLRLATAGTFRARIGSADLAGFTAHFEDGSTVETGDLVPAATVLEQIGTTPGLALVLERLGVDEETVSPGQVAAAVEFVLEGLHLTRRLSKVEADGQTIYGS